MSEACCVDKSVFSHDLEDVSQALGLSKEEEEAIRRVINDVLRGDRRMKISEMIEYIWTSKCPDLSLNARIYATFRLGMEVYGILVQGIVESLAGATRGESAEAT